MCKVSKSRKCRRLFLSDFRNSGTTRWIGQMTAVVIAPRVSIRGSSVRWVCNPCRSVSQDVRAKAGKGVEKSFFAGEIPKKKRSRGQRSINSCRQRGGKLREAFETSAPKVKNVGQSHIKHKGRKFLYMMKAMSEMSKRLKHFKKERPVPGDLSYSRTKRSWLVLYKYARKLKIPFGATEHPGRSFSRFLNHVYPDASDFGSLLGSLRSKGLGPDTSVRPSPLVEIPTAPRTLPGRPDIHLVIVDGVTEPLCRYCRTRTVFNSRGVHAPPRRHCNILDVHCALFDRELYDVRRARGSRGRSRRT